MRAFIVISFLASVQLIFGQTLVNKDRAYNNRNQEIGKIDRDGNTIRDAKGQVAGHVVSQGQVIDNNDRVVGTRGYDERRIAYDNDGNEMGVVGDSNHIWRNGQDIGHLGDDNKAIYNNNNQHIGNLKNAYYMGDQVYDGNDKYIGLVGLDNRTVYRRGKKVGYLDNDGHTVRAEGTNKEIGQRRNKSRDLEGMNSGANTDNNGDNTGTKNSGNIQNSGVTTGTNGINSGTNGNTANNESPLNNGNNEQNGSHFSHNGDNSEADDEANIDDIEHNIYDNQGKVIGYTGNDGQTVFDRNNNQIGYMDGHIARLNNGGKGYMYGTNGDDEVEKENNGPNTSNNGGLPANGANSENNGVLPNNEDNTGNIIGFPNNVGNTGSNSGAYDGSNQFNSIYDNNGNYIGFVGSDGQTVFDRNNNRIGFIDGKTARLYNGGVGYRYGTNGESNNGAIYGDRNGGPYGFGNGVHPTGPVQDMSGTSLSNFNGRNQYGSSYTPYNSGYNGYNAYRHGYGGDSGYGRDNNYGQHNGYGRSYGYGHGYNHRY